VADCKKILRLRLSINVGLAYVKKVYGNFEKLISYLAFGGGFSVGHLGLADT
jgi:hypothetical protein